MPPADLEITGVVNALDGVIRHGEQETGRQLRSACTGMEQSGRRMGEELRRHCIVRGQSGVEIAVMNTTSDTHEHVLRALHNFAIHVQQVGTLQYLEAEIVVREITELENLAKI